MPQIKKIIELIDSLIPPMLAESWDNCGLQVGNINNPAENIMVALDITKEIVKSAKQKKCNLIISHHPLFFGNIERIDINEKTGSIVKELIENNITLYSTHTNLDKSKEGFNKVFSEWLGLKNSKPIKADNLTKLVTFVPPSDTEKVFESLSNAGSGIIGNYKKASFRVSGKGTFEALEGAKPKVGELGFNEVTEDRLEMQFDPSNTKEVILALMNAHPYEEVVYDIYNLNNKAEIGIGVVGDLAEKITLKELIEKVKQDIGTREIAYKGKLDEEIGRVAVVPGSGSAYETKADVLITGDIKHHTFEDSKINLIDAGHFEVENFALEKFCDKLASKVKKQFAQVKVYFEKGQAPRRFY